MARRASAVEPPAEPVVIRKTGGTDGQVTLTVWGGKWRAHVCVADVCTMIHACAEACRLLGGG